MIKILTTILTTMIALSILLPLGAMAQSLGDLKDLASSDSVKKAGESLGGSLSDVLQGQLGIDQDQADGGIGSMLTLASEKLSAGDFDKLAGMIPGADKYLASAKSLGAVTSPLNDVAGLNNALGKLGISPETVDKFVPMITDYLGKLGGNDMNNLLGKVLGF